LPAPALINNQTLSLQKKLVLLSRVRETKNLAFLCEDTYDFDKFLRDIKVPPDLEPPVRHLLVLATCLNISKDRRVQPCVGLA
jgi:hypothetical protein